MTELLALAPSFTLFSFYLLSFSALVYGLTWLAERGWPGTRRWRGFWLASVAASLFPLLVLLIPAQSLPDPVISFPDLLAGGEMLQAGTPDGVAMPAPLDTVTLLCALWMVTVLVVGLWQYLRTWVCNYRLQRWVALAPTPMQAHQLSPQRRQQLLRYQRHTGIAIRITERQCSPFVVGLWQPTLVISHAAAEVLTPAQFSLMVRHELTHVARRDTWLMLLSQLLQSLFWFNPVLHRLLTKLHWAVEASCDSAVLAHKPQAVRQYARAMLNVLRATQASPAPIATAFIQHAQRTTTMRMQGILTADHKTTSTGLQRMVTLSGALLLAAGAFVLQPGLAQAKDEACFMNPVPKARVSSGFGQKEDRFHNGVDLAIARGTPVVATADGQVSISTDLLEGKPNYGKIIVIEHADGLRSLYSHLDSRAVEKGQQVRAGEQIGKVGETGKVTGPHLHFEILQGKNRVDPADYVAFPVERQQASLRLPTPL